MHVVFAVHQTKKLTGIQKYYYTLARELTLKGVDVSIIMDSTEGRWIAEAICGDNVKLYPIYPYAPQVVCELVLITTVGAQRDLAGPANINFIDDKAAVATGDFFFCLVHLFHLCCRILFPA